LGRFCQSKDEMAISFLHVDLLILIFNPQVGLMFVDSSRLWENAIPKKSDLT
jgi:hypothetical protein